MGAEMWVWPWRWMLSLAAAALCLVAGVKLFNTLWWKPRRVEEHFAKQGIRGPPYRFFIGNLREMVGLMLEASAKPMSSQSCHNILPRVLLLPSLEEDLWLLWTHSNGF
ncbi:hypothetical protein HPP92_005164 [Vanilla planifolia]|uniref:Cytochrome P450 n=1 Tax=Vanilla planifolia TaxID=51239 RepID=A0A835RGN3_VANPL|nr:hypothetical protein HPP92_005164 [Vanilla planifolia]